jgi:hypothetical protein
VKRRLGITLKELTEAGFVEYEPDKFAHNSTGVTQLPAAAKKKAKRVKKLPKIDPFILFAKLETGIEFTAEVRFDKTRRWRFDFANQDHMIAIEVEGGVWTEGRHTRGKGFMGDMEKYNAAAAAGWTLIRRVPTNLVTAETIELIKKAINHEGHTDQTNSGDL